MKKIILVLFAFSTISGLAQSMKFVGVRNNPTTRKQEFVQWDTLSLPTVMNDSAPINGVVSGSSTYNSNNGNFYIATYQNNQPVTLAYNVNQRNNFIMANQINFGVGTKVDLSNGKLYTVHGKRLGARGYISVTDPNTGIASLVDSLPNTINSFFGDGVVFNSNTHHLYFYYLDGNVGRLMDVDVSANPVTMNSVPVVTANGRSANMAMEFDLNTNLLHFISIEYNTQTRKSKLYFGILNPSNGAMNYEDSTAGYSGMAMGSGTFDQTGQNMCILAMDTNNRYVMVGYQVLGAYWFKTSIPSGNIYEIEANNFSYVQAKYANNIKENQKTEVTVYPNPVDQVLNIKSSSVLDQYHIYSIQGKLVRSGVLNAYHSQMDVSDFENGVYFIVFPEKNSVARFVISH